MTAIIKQHLRNLRGSQWLGILGLLALFLALRWNNYSAPLGRDEGEYAYAAQLLIHGLAPYQHAFIQKPPGIFYSYALADLLFPHCVWGPCLLAALCVAITTGLLGLIARMEFGEGVALPVMWLATPMVLLPGLEMMDANVEPFLMLPMLATLTVYCYSRQHGHKKQHWLAAGFLIATTLIFKYTALPVLAFAYLVWLLEVWRLHSSIASILRALAFTFAGGVLASLLELGYFLIHDGGKTFWECTVAFNRYYAGSNLFGWSYFFLTWEGFWRNWWILFLIPWTVLLNPQPRVWFWLGIFFCSLVATNGCVYLHYYAPVMPFWALLVALGIRAMALKTSRWLPGLSSWTGGLITAVVVLLVISPDLPWMLRSRQQFLVAKWAESPFLEAPLVADQVAQMSSPDDTVYVAGSEPEILYYAQRFSPTRFITSYPLMDPTPLASDYQHAAIKDLQQHPPKLIVFVQAGNSWTRQASTPPDFLNFMGQFLHHYDLVGAYVKPDPFHGYWSTSLNAAEYKAASLLLYRLKPSLESSTPSAH